MCQANKQREYVMKLIRKKRVASTIYLKFVVVIHRFLYLLIEVSNDQKLCSYHKYNYIVSVHGESLLNKSSIIPILLDDSTFSLLPDLIKYNFKIFNV